MFRTDSTISRSLMLLAAIGLCVSPMFAFGAQSDARGDMLCLKTMKTMKTTQFGELEQASQPAAVKSCCAKHALKSNDVQHSRESTQPIQTDSDPAPCNDSNHCACCLILHTSLHISPAAPLAGTLPDPATTLDRPAAEQCIVPGWHATLLRPPIG